MELKDVPREWLDVLIAEPCGDTERRFAEAIRQMALCQQKLELRSVISTVQPDGDVIISLLQGAGHTRVYARVDRITRQITFQTPYEPIS